MYTYKTGLSTSEHDRFVIDSPQTNLLQSSSWAKIKDSWGNDRLGFYKDDKLVAVASVLIQPLPLGFSMIYIPRGPIMDYHDKELVAFVVDQPELSIVFGRTKRRVDELTRGLKLRGFRAEGIHGDLDQNKRLRVIRDFKNDQIDILVATDVAARGLDISGVTHVYNYDIPQDPESYVHRIGRTGRAGESGQSITFVAPNEMGYLSIIENLTKKRMKGLKPPTAQEAFQAKKKVALKKIERDFADEAIRSNFDKFKGDAVKLAQEFTPEELALYILSLTVQDPETMPEVEIAREKPLPFKPSGGSFGGKGKGGRGNRGRDNNRRGGYRGDRNRDDRDGGYRDFKRKSKKNSRDFENRGNKRPHRTSSEKKNGFVIRNKGDK